MAHETTLVLDDEAGFALPCPAAGGPAMNAPLCQDGTQAAP